MSTKEKIIDALEHARKRNIRLVRLAMFNWCDPFVDKFGITRYKNAETPTECDAVGAILLLCGKESFGGPGGFQSDWVKVVTGFLEKDSVWLWKFMKGWEGYELTVDNSAWNSSIPDYAKDPVSKWAHSLSKKYTK